MRVKLFLVLLVSLHTISAQAAFKILFNDAGVATIGPDPDIHETLLVVQTGAFPFPLSRPDLIWVQGGNGYEKARDDILRARQEVTGQNKHLLENIQANEKQIQIFTEQLKSPGLSSDQKHYLEEQIKDLDVENTELRAEVAANNKSEDQTEYKIRETHHSMVSHWTDLFNRSLDQHETTLIEGLDDLNDVLSILQSRTSRSGGSYKKVLCSVVRRDQPNDLIWQVPIYGYGDRYDFSEICSQLVWSCGYPGLEEGRLTGDLSSATDVAYVRAGYLKPNGKDRVFVGFYQGEMETTLDTEWQASIYCKLFPFHDSAYFEEIHDLDLPADIY